MTVTKNIAATKNITATKKKRARYLELADELRAAVLRGDFSGSKTFPTESVLCKNYGVSRFTVREALRTLTQEGLIKRRRGSGTMVQPASARGGTLHQPLSNVGEILQYATGTTISFDKLGPQEVSPDIAEKTGMSPTGEWYVFRGARRAESRRRPIALTYAWVHPDLAEAVSRFEDGSPTLFGQIEQFTGRTVNRVTQDIQAVKATEEVAETLGLETDDPVLLILRCYFDKNDQLFEISASYHPGDRFTYSMHIEVD